MNVVLCLLVLLFTAPPPQALRTTSATTVEGITINGNRRIPRQTIEYNLQTKPGGELDPNVIARDVRALYALGYFEDIRVDEEPGNRGGVVVVFTVKETPLIRHIDYKGAKSFTNSEILQKFREKKVGLSVESPFDQTRVKRAEAVLKQMLAEKGHQNATVSTNVDQTGPGSVDITFNVNEGPKLKVEKITIEGNHAFTTREVKRAMKLVKEQSGLSALMGKDTYHDLKLADDITRISMLYGEHGYVRVVIDDPVVEVKKTSFSRTLPFLKPPFPFGVPLPFARKAADRYYITIKIEENDQYRIGDVKVTGNKLFTGDQIKAVLGLVQGNIFNEVALRKSFENLKKVYDTRGYINFTAVPLQDFDPSKKMVNLTVNIEEDRQFRVNRIAFNGNTTTRDKVLRREVMIDEQQVYNSQLWDLSILRLNQLGFFEEIKNEDAEIKPHPADDQVDINLKVKEKGRNTIGLNGGVSGIGGSFLGLNYTTNNFLGLGENVSLNLQGGTRQSIYDLSFTEPYLLNRPQSLGFSIYNSSFRYDQARQLYGVSASNLPQGLGLQNLLNFEQKHTGFNLSTSYPLKLFHRLGISYVLDNSETTGINPATQEYFQSVATQNQNFVVGGSFNTFHARRIVPTYTYNTVNNPYNPTQGYSFTGNFEFTGGFLGGDINFYRPTAEFRYYRPMNHGRNTLAMRATTSYIQSFTDLSVPFYERFFVGGDFDVRGFDFRSLSPISFITRTLPALDPVSRTIVNKQFDDIVYVGGDTQFVYNLEYRIPIIGQAVSLVPFMDMGNTWVIKTAALERKIVTPTEIQILPAQFLPGTNSGLRMSTGLEFQVIMPVINAPFRLDFAFNPARIDQNYIGPVSGIPFGIHQPGRNFKFTVGRTF
jgi:outer membrane protein insertion porin family